MSSKIFLVRVCDKEGLIERQKQDEWHRDIYFFLKDGALTGDPSVVAMVMGRGKDYILENDLLYFLDKKENKRVAVPRNLIQEVCREIHDILVSGHLGIKKTRQRCFERSFGHPWERMLQILYNPAKYAKDINMTNS